MHHVRVHVLQHRVGSDCEMCEQLHEMRGTTNEREARQPSFLLCDISSQCCPRIRPSRYTQVPPRMTWKRGCMTI